ncbi:MAG TPA: efflux RND transporter periplasmic adaptor subunit, partial [Anaeromyxobacter sp.]
ALPSRDAAEPTAAVRLAKPLARLDGDGSRATGELRSRLQATLSAKVSGTILEVDVQPGDRVRKGDALVRLDPATLLIQLDQGRAARKMALAARDAARADLSRTAQLFGAGSAPQALLDRVSAGSAQADAAYDQADAQVRLLEQNLKDHVLRAPFDGVVVARTRNVGDFVAAMPPTPVATLVATEAVEVRLSVPEGLVDPLRPGVELHGRALPGGASFVARVTSVGAIVDPATRAVEVLAEVRAAGGTARGALRPGGLAEVDLGATAAGEGPFVPAQAVAQEGERRFVWVVEGGAARRREVRVEAVTPRWFRVRAGLAGEDAVVVEGNAGLRDGMRVAVAG